jgi:hypothetical protein
LWRNRNPIHCWWECKLVQPLRKGVWRFLKKTRDRTAIYDPLLDIYPKEYKTGYSRDTCTPMFIEALFTIAKLWIQPRCPTSDEWIKKLWYMYTILLRHMWFEGKWMQLEDIMLSEVTQAQKHKGCMFSLTHGRWINIHTKQA